MAGTHLLATTIGVALLGGARRAQPTTETIVLAAASTTAFAIVDAVYPLVRRISVIYLANAMPQLASIALALAGARRSRARAASRAREMRLNFRNGSFMFPATSDARRDLRASHRRRARVPRTSALSRTTPIAPQRVLFVEASVGGVLGGSLTGILHLIERMDRRRFTPALVLYEMKHVVPGLRAGGVPVHILPPLPVPTPDGKRRRAARAWLRARELATVVAPRARALARLFRAEQPDVVYLANALTTNLDGVVAAAMCNLPIIIHQKGLRRIGPVERWLSRWVDTCIGMTEEVTAHAQAKGVHARRFVTIYDGINCDAFAPGGGAAVRREFGIPDDAPLVGIVGHLQRWKGQHLVVEAVAAARERHPDLRCLIVGGVHRWGEDFATELRARIAALGLERHVILTGARRDVAACMDAMDVVIHSSIRPEPFGRVLIEAMALGRPVIAPRLGGPCEIVADGETGLLVTARDAKALGNAIVTLVGDGTRRLAMGRAARERVDRVFDIRHHVRAIEQVFDDVLGVVPTLGSAERAIAAG